MAFRFSRVAALIAVALTPAVSSAQVTTIDFSTHPGPDYTPIAQTFGDHANLNVSNQTRVGFGNAATLCTNVDKWNAGYSSLPAVAFACANGYVGELFFSPTAGNQVFLQSLQLGSYPSTNGAGPTRTANVQVFDTDWTSLYTFTGPVNSTVSISPNVGSTTGLYLQWGTDWDVGVNYITTNVTATEVTATPEPASLVLFATGMGALALVRRKRRQNA
jgi:PEP-CTERM motif